MQEIAETGQTSSSKILVQQSLFLRNHSMNLQGFYKTLTSDSHCHNIVATLC